MTGYNIAVVGATGAVGTRIIKMLEETSLPIASVKLLASQRSVDKTLEYNGQKLKVQEALPSSFDGVDLAFFSAGGSVSK